jgi:protein-tyrosine phosphatase
VNNPSTETLPVEVELLKFPASFNWRDLSGLPTRNKQAVATRRLYRSGDPSRLDSQAAGALLGAIGLRTIIDLRTTIELKDCGIERLLPGCKHLHLPLFETVRQNWVAPSDHSPTATAARYMEMLRDGTETIVQIVLGIGSVGMCPLLIHCAAGRDRTGIVVACLLDLLEVADEAIATDYSLSDPVVCDGGRAHSTTMLEFLTLLRAEYGSTRDLLSARGVADNVIDQASRDLVAIGA